MREKKLFLNTFTSLLYQIVAIICGFVLPRLILRFYGSTVNGLVSSINQFIQIISFLELGMGAVVQSSLYKPLYEKNRDQVSRIWVSANRFFRKIALILLIYIIVLTIVYPLLVNTTFDFWYTASLIAAISISSFAQYYFGIVNQLLLTADQRGYVHYTLQTLTYIANIAACVFLIYQGASIQIVKLTTSVLFLIRPVVLYFYVQHHYSINRKIQYTVEPIQQKWNGVAQHISSVVIDGTDTIVLSFFSTLQNVSIYSVYHLVIYGVKTLFMSMTNGIQALLGEVVAKGDKAEIRNYYARMEWVIHTSVIFVFGCTGVLVIPFVRVYTAGIYDVNYIIPSFACLLTLAHGFHCLRLPYNMMIKAFGKYRETQTNYIVTAIINIVISIATVRMWGLIGVAIGTLAAMVYQTIWMAWYNMKYLVDIRPIRFVKQLFVDFITVFAAASLSRLFSLKSLSFSSWILLAIEVMVTWLLIVLVMNALFYRNLLIKVFHKLKR